MNILWLAKMVILSASMMVFSMASVPSIRKAETPKNEIVISYTHTEVEWYIK